MGGYVSGVAIYQGWHYIKGCGIIMDHFCSQTYRSAKRGWHYIKGGDISRVVLYQV